MKRILLLAILTVFLIAANVNAQSGLLDLTVVRQDGTPAVNVDVQFQKKLWNFQHTNYSWATYKVAYTDKDGRVLMMLPQGDYKIIVGQVARNFTETVKLITIKNFNRITIVENATSSNNKNHNDILAWTAISLVLIIFSAIIFYIVWRMPSRGRKHEGSRRN